MPIHPKYSTIISFLVTGDKDGRKQENKKNLRHDITHDHGCCGTGAFVVIKSERGLKALKQHCLDKKRQLDQM